MENYEQQMPMPQQQMAPPMAPQLPTDAEGNLMSRTFELPNESRAALVSDWLGKIEEAKAFWHPQFTRMREDMDFVAGKQWDNSHANDTRYVANIVQRHIQQRVASLYAKNPTVVARRRKTLDFAIWDGGMGMLQAAQAEAEMAMAAGMQPSIQTMEFLGDFQAGVQRRQFMDKLSKTMEIVFKYALEQQIPDFKLQMKQLVRRTCICGVGYVKIGFERIMERRPEDADKIRDITEKLATLQRIAVDLHDNQTSETSKEIEQLRLMMADLQSQELKITREGMVFDFPVATSIIPDPKCRQLKDFVGASWVAQEFVMTNDDIKEIYGKDVSVGRRMIRKAMGMSMPSYTKNEDINVYEIYSKKDNLKYIIAEGYPDFLAEPTAPYPCLERFWPFFTLSFNDIESDKDIYPCSDSRLLQPMQREYNRARQGLREQRHANRPKYIVPKGMLDDEDRAKLQSHPANAVLELNAVTPGTNVGQIIQPMPLAGFDPMMYDTSMIFDDILKVVGSQEANMGGTSNGTTATEVSVAEGSRMSSIQSNIDDLDDMLSNMANAAGQVMLKYYNEETVKKIAGPGATWPMFDMQTISEEIFLEIEAGSSGRPNKAQEISNFERIAPIIMQIPGISPEWLAKQAIMRLDDRMDISDAVIAGIPSVVAMNAQMPPNAGGDSESNPDEQGKEGGNKTERPPNQSSSAPDAKRPETTST
ncbi:hypothetical protein UFOVP477_7 [uncultured Caudovirales phage]|uniref:Portal protein n=1 Tax=uncultured Caudovirales phage TaxID=2100421 RepID=A0A6J5MFS0_9CAUD|nr:hypothetical protein UFOVP477_7 [uncultured Caudovirales phage]CAB4163223.1 hypothetical protein UFOVP798_11 [uncultured Caudovirales phage]CAB4191502.1 hypothetical protein UFOVP1222_37 [uncultured Caudovirales phage]